MSIMRGALMAIELSFPALRWRGPSMNPPPSRNHSLRGINARVEKGLVMKDAGCIGMILANTAASGEELLPAVAVGMKEGDRIREYVVSDRKPRAMLSFGGTVLNVRSSPVVAAFSSRGPNTVVPEKLKPGLVGPGVNILAGWSGSIAPTGLAKDNRRSQFNIMPGSLCNWRQTRTCAVSRFGKGPLCWKLAVVIYMIN